MTIAAGFVASDGIVLCADTLYTDGQTKEYRDKIFSWEGLRTFVGFAVAGHATIGRMVVDDCRDALDGLRRKGLSMSSILATIRPIIKRTYEQYVDTRPLEERAASDFWLLIAISTQAEKFRLYSSVRASLSRIDTFECVGIGRQLGRYIIDPTYHQGMTVDEVALLGVHALASAKERVDGVGGRSQFVAVKDGFVSPIAPHNFDDADDYILEYRGMTARLLLDIANKDLTEDGFGLQLALFGRKVHDMRKAWNFEAEPWRMLLDSLRGRRAVKIPNINVTIKVPPNPQPPTTDPKR